MSSGTSDVDGSNRFVFDNGGTIVRLDVTVIQPVGDYFRTDSLGDGIVGVQLYGACNAGVAEDEMTVENCDGARPTESNHQNSSSAAHPNTTPATPRRTMARPTSCRRLTGSR